MGIRRNDPAALELEISDATVVDVGYVLDPLGLGFVKVQAIRVFNEAFIFEIPREQEGVVRMPRPLHPAGVETGSKKPFVLNPARKKSSGTEPKS